MVLSLATLIFALAVSEPVNNNVALPDVSPVRAMMTDADCSQSCQEMRDSENKLITYFCIPVPNNGGEGSGCSATITECTITTSTSCGPIIPEGDDEMLVSSSDGRVLSSVGICAIAKTLVKDDRIDFVHLRQRNARAFRDASSNVAE